MRASWWLAKRCSNIKRCSSNKTFLAALFGQGFTGGAIENIVRISACLFCQNGGCSIVCQANFARQVASVCSKMFWYNMLPFLWSVGNTTVTLCLLIHRNAIPSETFLFSSVCFPMVQRTKESTYAEMLLTASSFFSKQPVPLADTATKHKPIHLWKVLCVPQPLSWILQPFSLPFLVPSFELPPF